MKLGDLPVRFFGFRASTESMGDKFWNVQALVNRRNLDPWTDKPPGYWLLTGWSAAQEACGTWRCYLEVVELGATPEEHLLPFPPVPFGPALPLDLIEVADGEKDLAALPLTVWPGEADEPLVLLDQRQLISPDTP